jgi:DNA modification methylase
MINTIIHGDCIDVMLDIPDKAIDLTITSPPYDNMRTYNGYTFDFEGTAQEIYRVTKDGGILVWVVGDETISGTETGTSFKQALYFKEIVGFKLHDTMIWNKQVFTAVGSLRYRYASVFEYMFILTKGKPVTFNPIKDRKNKWHGTKVHGRIRQRDGSTKPVSNTREIQEYGQRFNVWEIFPHREQGHKHPAMFPEQLANDHILSWSNEGDIILDPMCGSGTTCKMALLNNRKYIGIDISEEYCEIARERIAQAHGGKYNDE